MTLLQTRTVGRVAVVTLDDPGRRNALTFGLVDEIMAAFDRIEADEAVGAVVVTGAPPAFCAGASLADLGSSRSEGLRRIYEGFLRVSRCPLPTLAAVNGAAVGAGTNLALACDVRIAGEAARFDTRFGDLGLHPGGGHTWMARRALGPQGAAATILFGQRLDGREAERVGLVWRCVPDGDLHDTAVEVAARAASMPRELTIKVKATLAAMAEVRDHPAAVEAELEPQLWSLDQPDFPERLAALQKKVSKRSR
jgi:enoyl-CoA hydratase